MIKNNKHNHSSLYFIHGYQSSPNGDKATLFKNRLNATAIKYRDCKPEELEISSCLNKIHENIKQDENVTLIGSSLGGFLASSIALNHLNVKKIILLNPATISPSTNLDSIRDIPRQIAKDMQNEELFNQKIHSKIFIIRGTEDDVILDSWVLEFAKFQEAVLLFLKDDHRFSKNLMKLPEIISKLLDY